MENTLPRWLGRIQIFQNCTKSELEEISKLLILKQAKKKEILFYEGEACEAIYFINKGRVKIYKTTEDGREQIVNLLTEGEMFPHVGLYGGNAYPATSEAIEDCSLYLMYVNKFTQFLSQSPSLTVKLLQELEGGIRELQARLTSVLSKDMTEKIMNVLASFAKNKGVKIDEGYKLEIELTHQDIANLVGTTRETASRIISQLKKEDKVYLDHRLLIVKEDRN